MPLTAAAQRSYAGHLMSTSADRTDAVGPATSFVSHVREGSTTLPLPLGHAELRRLVESTRDRFGTGVGSAVPGHGGGRGVAPAAECAPLGAAPPRSFGVSAARDGRRLLSAGGSGGGGKPEAVFLWLDIMTGAERELMLTSQLASDGFLRC